MSVWKHVDTKIELQCIKNWSQWTFAFAVIIVYDSNLERLEVGTIHMCLTSVSGYRPLTKYKPTPSLPFYTRSMLAYDNLFGREIRISSDAGIWRA